MTLDSANIDNSVVLFSMTVRQIVVLVVLCDIHGNIWCYEFLEIFFTDDGKYFSIRITQVSTHHLHSTFWGFTRKVEFYFITLMHTIAGNQCLTNQSMG